MGVGVEWWSRGPEREVRSEEVERGELKETKEEPQESAPSARWTVPSLLGLKTEELSRLTVVGQRQGVSAVTE